MRYLDRKYYKYLPILISFLVISKPVSANTSVNVSNNGSNSQVKINNVINSSNSTSTNTSNTTTDIRIETNGEVKEYHGTGNQNINIESSDGKNSVKINNNINGESKTQAVPNIEASKSATSTGLIEQDRLFKDQNTIFWENLRSLFDKIWYSIFKTKMPFTLPRN